MNLSTILPIVKQQISNFGSDAVLKGDAGDGVYTPDGKWVVTENNTNIKVLFEAYSSEEVGGEILSGDVKVMTYLESEPTTSNKVIFNGITYNIINIQPFIAQNTLFYYELHCRV